LRWSFGAALVLLPGLAAVWWGFGNRAVETPAIIEPRPAAPPNSIAVLAFDDMSPMQDQAWFADGVSEEILNLLAQTSALQVIARTSSFSFKDENVDIATIADKLNVAHVLEGSVRKSGDMLRITAQLVDATNSMHLWSETYDRELGDILAVQTDIAASVAEQLKVKLADDWRPQLQGPVNPEAYTQFLQGNFFYGRRGPGDVQRARDHYRRAVEIDPDFARAWAGLAGVYNVMAFTGEIDWKTARARLREAAKQALAHDPNLAEAHARAATYYWSEDRATALEHWNKALSLDPNSPLVLGITAGKYVLSGRLDEAIELQKRVVALDPLGFANRANLAIWLLADGRLEDAKAQIIRAQELSPMKASEYDVDLGSILILERRFEEALATIGQWPEGPDRDKALALVYPALGREADGDAAFNRLIAAPGIDTDIRAAEVFAHRGEIDEAFRRLAAARDEIHSDPWTPEREQWLDDIAVSPFLRPLRSDPRWRSWFVDFLEQPEVAEARQAAR
jgi:TolB-like protein/Flp pilus assembly protein TadD